MSAGCVRPPGRLRVDRRGVERVVAVGMQESRRPVRRSWAPRRSTFRAARRGWEGPLASRWATMLPASVGLRPEMRVSSAAEAMFTSTPTAFTQSSTTASRLRARRVWLTHRAGTGRRRWIWVDLDQLGQRVLQAAGDGHGAAQAHVEVGNSPWPPVRTRNTPTAPASTHHDLGHAQLRGAV